MFLGRPRRPYAKVVFLSCELGSIIRPTGWNSWRNPDNERTAFYAEYENVGAGAAIDEWVERVHVLTAEEAERYVSLEGLWRGWNPVEGNEKGSH